jgi:hypothetical protein
MLGEISAKEIELTKEYRPIIAAYCLEESFDNDKFLNNGKGSARKDDPPLTFFLHKGLDLQNISKSIAGRSYFTNRSY